MALFDFGFNFSDNNASVGLSKEDTAWLYQKQSDQWRANTEWYNKNGYNYLKQGLLDAGYNPLMALGATPLNGATVQGSVMNERSNARSFGTQGLPFGLGSYRASMRNVNADTTLKNAQADEVHTRETLENAQKLLLDKRLPHEDRRQLAEVIGLEIDNMEKQTRIQNLKADTELKSAQTSLTAKQTEQIGQSIDLLRKENIISDKQARYLQNHPQEAEALLRAGMYTGVLGNVFGGNVGLKLGR